MDGFGQNTGVIFDWALFRRDVRRDVRNCALFLFFFYAVNVTASIIYEVAYAASNPAASEGLVQMAASGADPQALGDAMGGGEIGMMAIIGIVAGGCVFLIPRGKRFFTDVALPAAEPMTPRLFIGLVLVMEAIQLVYGLIVTLIDYLLPEGLSLGDSYDAAMEGLVTPLGMLYVILVGPVFEELIFRGAIMGSLRRYGDNFAILFSSLLFGFYHALMLQIPFAFVLGLLLGYVAARWSLRAAIALHMINNGFSALISDTGNEALAEAGGLFMIFCVAATVVFLIRFREQIRERARAGAAYYARTYANGFSSIAFWIFVVVMTAFGLAQMSGVFEMS